MKNTTITTAIASIILFLTACNNNQKNVTEATIPTQTSTKAISQSIPVQETEQFGYKKGQQVPNDQVCMVNDAFMGKKQIEVALDGKMYYGCCNMCKERIPKEEKVRYGIDPFTGEKVDKATSYIVLIGNNGEVAYFANKANYEKFIAENKI